MLPTPHKFTLVAGIGEGSSTLNAFDVALLDSGLGNLNLLKVSSILPPKRNFSKNSPSLPAVSLLPLMEPFVAANRAKSLLRQLV